MKKFLPLKMTTTTTTTMTKGWKPGKRFNTEGYWTYRTNTNNPKGKVGAIIDNFGRIDFGQRRFEFKRFGHKDPVFTHAESFIAALKRRGFRELGMGAYSTVLAKDGQDRVIKVNRRPDGWIDYVHWAAKKDSPFSPKVFSYKKIKGKKRDFSVSTMERLEYTFASAPKDHSLKILPDLIWRAKDNPMAASFTDVLVPGLSSFIKELHEEFKDERLDLHDGNVMVRKDGSFVLVDPISGKQRTDYGRLKAGDFSPVIQIIFN